MKITPSPCLVEKESISVFDAVEKMNFFQVDYILLVGAENKITGIFTERDLLLYFKEISESNSPAPVSDFMQRNVKTLSLGLIQTAPEFMRDHQIRHLPITHLNTTTERLEIVGMVTSASIYDQLLVRRGLRNLFPTFQNLKKKRVVGVASPDGSLWKLMEKVFSGSPNISVQRYRLSELQKNNSLQNACEECDAIIMDIDDAPERFWRPTVEYVAKNKGLEYLVVTLTEEYQDSRIQKLKQLEMLGLVQLAKKPMDISKVVLGFERFWLNVEKE